LCGCGLPGAGLLTTRQSDDDGGPRHRAISPGRPLRSNGRNSIAGPPH
jgi:hypothetical protein